MHLKRQLLIPSLTDVLPSILLLYAVDHQLPTLAPRLSMDCLGGSQQLAILEPFHICLDISYLTAQSGFLGESSFNLLLN